MHFFNIAHLNVYFTTIMAIMEAQLNVYFTTIMEDKRILNFLDCNKSYESVGITLINFYITERLKDKKLYNDCPQLSLCIYVTSALF